MLPTLTIDPLLPLEHAGHEGSDEQERGPDFDRENRVEVLGGELLDRRPDRQAGVVHQDVDAADLVAEPADG